jgi:hypothetical protein
VRWRAGVIAGSPRPGAGGPQAGNGRGRVSASAPAPAQPPDAICKSRDVRF